MKKSLLIISLILSSFFLNAQVVEWSKFNERHMDTVMFNVMNDYRTQKFSDNLVWSPLVQSVIMRKNYEYVKVHGFYHNTKWLTTYPYGIDGSLKKRISDENVNPSLFKSKTFEYVAEGVTYQNTLDYEYAEILVSIPTTHNGWTYQRLANHAIASWNKSSAHAGHMNAKYNDKVIVGVITYYSKNTNRLIISFVYIS